MSDAAKRSLKQCMITLTGGQTAYENPDPREENEDFPTGSLVAGYVITVAYHKTRRPGFLFLTEYEATLVKYFEHIRQQKFAGEVIYNIIYNAILYNSIRITYLQPWIDDNDRALFVTKKGNPWQGNYCEIFEDFMNGYGLTPTTFRTLFTNEVLKCTNPDVLQGRSHAQANTDSVIMIAIQCEPVL